MVGLPHTTNDPKLGDEMQLENDEQLKSNDVHLVNNADGAPLKHTLIIPNLGMQSEKKDNQIFALAYSQDDVTNLDSPADKPDIEKSKDKASGKMSIMFQAYQN